MSGECQDSIWMDRSGWRSHRKLCDLLLLSSFIIALRRATAMPHRFSINELLPHWITRIRPYPPGKPIEEVERELGHTAVKLASNENPLGPSPKALEALRHSLDRANFYPDGAGYYLRRKLAEFQQLDMSQIILGAASTDLIEPEARPFLRAGAKSLTRQPPFY